MDDQLTFEIRGVPVSFPYQPYSIQLRYMEKVIEALQNGQNALLESPTGSGKTLCLLCATLAWRSTMQSVIVPGQTQRGPPLIVYASRTHSQLQQALRQLKMTAYKPRVSIIASRDALCVHPKVSTQYSGTQLNQQCQLLSAARKCAFHNHVDEFERGNPRLIDEIFDIEDMVYIGQEHEVCPYYLAWDNAKQADFLFIPYNYLVDPSLRKNLTLDPRLEKAIIIFDEAHNVESSCMESSSFDFTELEMAKSIIDTDFCIQACSDPNWIAPSNVALEAEHIVNGALLLKERLLNLEQAVHKMELGSDKQGRTQAGQYILTLLNHAGFDLNDPHLDRQLEAMINVCGTRSESECCLRKLREYINIVKRAAAGDILNHYRVHIHEEVQVESKPKKGFSRASANGKTLSFWCFSSAVTMKEFMALNIHALLLTSGTLSPLPALRTELEIPFPVVLENEHVIGRDQLYLGLIRRGPSGLQLNTSFKNRNRPEFVAELGNVVAEFAKIIPDGLLVFFPSYPALTAAMEGWKISGVINRIEASKKIFLEPRQQSDLKGCLAAYREAIDQGRGAIFVAVCRGKLSEGIDFSDKAARGVIICGLPFASTQAPRVRLKREYLNKISTGAGGNWYITQAWRAVNQAVGRVIRHRNDYGAIMLCDERFCENNSSQLSLWLRKFIQKPNDFNETINHLKRFFNQERPNDDSASRSEGVNRSCDPRFSQIQPISALYQKFRSNRMQNSSNGLLEGDIGQGGDVLRRPVKVRSRDWGQTSTTSPPTQSSVSRSQSLQRSNSLPQHIPNLLSRQPSGSGLSINTTQSNRVDQNKASNSETVVVKSRESAQLFLNVLKSSVRDDKWPVIAKTIRDLSQLKKEESPDPQRVRELLQQLFTHIDGISDCKKLRLHDRMREYLPRQFRDRYADLVKHASSQTFKLLVRQKSPESYQKFLKVLKGMVDLNKQVKQRDQEHVNGSSIWTDEEKNQFRKQCRDMITVLWPLDRNWPKIFQAFVYPGQPSEIYGECLATAMAEFEAMTLEERVNLNRKVPPDQAPKLAPSPSLNRTCQFCESEANNALRSSICNHIGCWDCWISHLKRSKTCLCNAPVSKSKLDRVMF